MGEVALLPHVLRVQLRRPPKPAIEPRRRRVRREDLAAGAGVAGGPKLVEEMKVGPSAGRHRAVPRFNDQRLPRAHVVPARLHDAEGVRRVCVQAVAGVRLEVDLAPGRDATSGFRLDDPFLPTALMVPFGVHLRVLRCQRLPPLAPQQHHVPALHRAGARDALDHELLPRSPVEPLGMHRPVRLRGDAPARALGAEEDGVPGLERVGLRDFQAHPGAVHLQQHGVLPGAALPPAAAAHQRPAKADRRQVRGEADVGRHEHRDGRLGGVGRQGRERQQKR
mmetsp:Transcript_122388/g.351677  ORF Transcript_122388/g.351677 Transcript_122388/m.351677 type:complete len:280 (+) Transcript_122388:358-1197(+)